MLSVADRIRLTLCSVTEESVDKEGIVQVMKEQKWSSFQWSGEYDEENEAIEAAQSLRGFHTLEYLLFKDGKARTVK